MSDKMEVEIPAVKAVYKEPENSNRRIFDTPLSTQRYVWVQNFIKEHTEIKSVTDGGCGNGRLMNWLKSIDHLCRVNFIDSDPVHLDIDLDYNFSPGIWESIFGRQTTDNALDIKVFHGDISVPDDRLNADCFVMVEVVEHLPPEHVELCMRTVFSYYRPPFVVITTPNIEFNVLLRQPGEEPSKFRHWDHKFEWTRQEFQDWAHNICHKYNYSVSFSGVGDLPNSEPFGYCTQIATFQRLPEYSSELSKTVENIDLLINKLDCKNTSYWAIDTSLKRVTLVREYDLPGRRFSAKPANQEDNFDWSTEQDNFEWPDDNGVDCSDVNWSEAEKTY